MTNNQRRIIINLNRLAHGGGQQNGMSFLSTLAEIRDPKDYRVAVLKNSLLHRHAVACGFPVVLSDNKWFMELFCRRYFQKGDVCFNFFGPPWRRSKDWLVNVSGVAYSNLFYPEIDFWKYHSTFGKTLKHLTDRLRLFQIGAADYWIFETEELLRRSRLLAKYPEERTAAVRMCPSVLVKPENVSEEAKSRFESKLTPGSRRLLFLAGGNPNKRIINVASILYLMRVRFRPNDPVEIVVTLPPDNGYFKKIKDEFSRFGLSKCLVNVGPVPPQDVASLITCCRCMCLFSVLESFSNNMVEAWNMGIPLVVTDSSWASSEAGDAAFYLDPDHGEQACGVLWDAIQDAEKRRTVVGNGRQRLESFPDPVQKCEAYLRCIEQARQLGGLGKSRRNIVRWGIFPRDGS